MSAQLPHYHLFTHSTAAQDSDGGLRSDGGLWRFILAHIDGHTRFEVSDSEPDIIGNRLALLAVLRGLEALDQPSQVTLHSSSRYVLRGFRYGLPAWRMNRWCWERFGVMEPVSNADLWQRIDHALQYHRVGCYAWKNAPASTLRYWSEPVVGLDATVDTSASYHDQANAEMLGQQSLRQQPIEGERHEASRQRQQVLTEWANMFCPRRTAATAAVA